MSASNQNPKTNFFQKLAVIAKEPPAIIGSILLLAGSFFGGMQFMQLQLQPQIDLLKTKTEEQEKDIARKKTEIQEQATEIQEQATEIQKQATEIARHKNCEGSITYPIDNEEIKGNIQIEGTVSLCTEKRKWLVISPITTTNEKGEEIGRIEDTDCYVQGEVIRKTDGRFEKGTTSITKKQEYHIYLLAVGDQPTNSNLTSASKKTTPWISCSTANVGQNQLAMITVHNR